MNRIVVVGGGIAGLAAANRITELAKEKSFSVDLTLVETSQRLGGSIATEKICDFVIEAGPDTFITEKPSALRLCERLGLTARLVSTQSAYQKIYIVNGGKLVPLPDGFFLLAPTRFWPFIYSPLFSWRGKLRMGAEVFLPRSKNHQDESLGSFVRRRLGAEALQRVAQPLIGGIYASDPDQLSLTATMPRFKEMERAKGSIIRAMWLEQKRRTRAEAGSGARWSLFVTLAGGMQELVDSIVQRISTSAIRLNARVTHLSHDQEKKNWRVAIADAEPMPADAVVIAAPGFQAAEILEPIANDAAMELRQIAYASTATVSLGYTRRDFPRPPDSFGFVVPAVEQRKIMACTFSSLKYPGRAPEGHILLRAFVGGALQPELFADDDAAMIKNVRGELASLLGVVAEPVLSRLWRHPKSMPQYHIGHAARVERIESKLRQCSSIALAGSAYHGVGISDCVRSGEEAAEQICAVLQLTP